MNKKHLTVFTFCILFLSLFSMSYAEEPKGLHITYINANTDVISGDIVTVYVGLANDLTKSQSFHIEAGIFTDTIAGQWGILSFINQINVDSCDGGSFVDTKLITLHPGDTGEIILHPIAPNKDTKLSDGATNWDTSHSVVVGLYDICGEGYVTSTKLYGSANGAYKVRNINIAEEETFNPYDKKCFTGGDCDDFNANTIDTCIGTTNRHCSYICKSGEYDVSTGTCTDKPIINIPSIFTIFMVLLGGLVLFGLYVKIKD